MNTPSIAEIKTYLRLDTTEEDLLLASLLLAAKAHAEDYLQKTLTAEIPEPVRQAILILAGHFYEQRAGEDIPEVVYALLSPYRTHQW